MSTSLSHHIKNILLDLGEDITRAGLAKTPERAARALSYLTQGYHQSLDEIINEALFDAPNNEMVLIKNIELYSLCEHHLLPFFGKCHIAYVPNKKILGLSKFGRIVDLFAQRLQVQERLTEEIAKTIYEVTQAQGIGVVIEAQHLCMMMRGVQKQNSQMRSTTLLGSFRTDALLRQEFLQLL